MFAEPDANGWVKVERPHANNAFEHAGDEDDASIWVLFSKQLGGEKFCVRFPQDPTTTYLSPDEMELTAAQHRLLILQPSRDVLEQRAQEIALLPGTVILEVVRLGEDRFDLFYRSEGQWVREHLLLTPHHLYLLQTKSTGPQIKDHETFVHSFVISEHSRSDTKD